MLDPILADIFNLIADIAAAVTFAGMVVFVVLYGTFYQWRKRRAGKSVFLLALSVVIVAGISFLALWVSPDYWLRPFWRMAGWIFSVYAVGYLLYALLYNWRNRHPLEIPPKPHTGKVPVQTDEDLT